MSALVSTENIKDMILVCSLPNAVHRLRKDSLGWYVDRPDNPLYCGHEVGLLQLAGHLDKDGKPTASGWAECHRIMHEAIEAERKAPDA